MAFVRNTEPVVPTFDRKMPNTSAYTNIGHMGMGVDHYTNNSRNKKN